MVRELQIHHRKIKNKLLEASATLVGCTIGAGILSIPYVIAKAGFITGSIDLLIIGLLILVLNLMIGEVSLRTRGIHQLTGYASRYLGKTGGFLMAFGMFFANNGAIIAYLIMAGDFLSQLIEGNRQNAFLYTILFFALISFLIYLGLEAIEKTEVFMMFLFIGLIIFIFLITLPHINLHNLIGFRIPDLMIPYGVILFASLGVVALPEMREEIKGEEEKFRKAITLGTVIPLVIYFIFSLAVIGVSGLGTDKAAIPGLLVLGEVVVKLGLLFGVLTMATTFLAIGLALKEMYYYDFKVDKTLAWFLSCFIPLFFFLIGVRDFIGVLSVTGAISGGILGTLIILIHSRAKITGDRKPEFVLNISPLVKYLVLTLFIAGVVYQIILETVHLL